MHALTQIVKHVSIIHSMLAFNVQQVSVLKFILNKIIIVKLVQMHA